MQLDDTQKQTVTQWIRDGLKLSEIQSRLADQLGLTMTYMEARMLVDDLKLIPKDVEPPKPPQPPVPPPSAAAAPLGLAADPMAGPDALETEALPPEASSVSVSVDQVTRPGSMVSGQVTFTDGMTAAWWVDQAGRMGVAPRQKGYRPLESDLEAFQLELQRALQHLGL